MEAPYVVETNELIYIARWLTAFYEMQDLSLGGTFKHNIILSRWFTLNGCWDASSENCKILETKTFLKESVASKNYM